MKKKLIIFGSGGLAREVLWVAREMNNEKNIFDIIGFIDENSEKWGLHIDDLPVLGGLNWIKDNFSNELYGTCGIGNTKTRKKIHDIMKQNGLKATNIIHPSVKMSKYVELGEGVVITAGNILTTQIKLHDFVFLNLGCTVGHDAVLHAYSNCAPNCNISGNVIFKQGVHLGTGVQVIQGLTIGEWTIIGAGAVVLKNLPSNSVAVGIPAKVIKKRE